MSENKSLTYEKIFARMHRELRSWNRDIPESPDRLDPILRIMMQMHAHQLSRLDRRIDLVWEKAKESLIRTVCPESMRWPIPAITVMSCKPEDAAIEVDPHTRFFYKERRERGRTFFFSALRKEKILSAEVKYIFLQTGDSFIDLDIPAGGEDSFAVPAVNKISSGINQLYLAIDYDGATANFADTAIFIRGNSDLLKQMQWSTWYPGSSFGAFHEDCGFCPGQKNALESMFSQSDNQVEWGSLRSTGDLYPSLANSFIRLPEDFVSTWEIGPPDKNLLEFIGKQGHALAGESGNLYWIRIDLPEKGRRDIFSEELKILFNCFIVANKNELTLFKHTGGYKLIEIELPDNLESILEINRVVDSNGREYKIRYMASERTQGIYSLEERDNKLVLWFDYTKDIDRPPDSITVYYSVTAGVAANGIDTGEITELYESHPGIVSAQNVLPTAGAIPAKTSDQIATEVAARLRNRDRALSFTEISNWVTAYDPRIKEAKCANSIERAERGIRRCIQVTVSVDSEKFYSDGETDLLKERLGTFLKLRVPVNTHFKIEIAAK